MLVGVAQDLHKLKLLRLWASVSSVRPQAPPVLPNARTTPNLTEVTLGRPSQEAHRHRPWPVAARPAARPAKPDPEIRIPPLTEPRGSGSPAQLLPPYLLPQARAPPPSRRRTRADPGQQPVSKTQFPVAPTVLISNLGRLPPPASGRSLAFGLGDDTDPT